MNRFDIVEQKTCGDCKHFRRHYIQWERGYLPLSYGHCVFPRLKKRYADQYCAHWTPVETEPFAPF